MLTELGTIREFETPNFRVIVDAVEESDLDLSWDEDGQTRAGLESGRLIAFVARARVIFKPTGQTLGSDYLGGCVYESLSSFEDHRECAAQNRKAIKQQGRFQIYRNARPYEHCLSASDKLKPRGLATRAKAEAWAQANAKEAWDIFETGRCGSYFADMVASAIEEAREKLASTKEALCGLYVRTVQS